MKTINLICLLFIMGVVLLSGCSQEITCNNPYIKVGDECCLDANSNRMCDKDEQTTNSYENINEEKGSNNEQDVGSTSTTEKKNNCISEEPSNVDILDELKKDESHYYFYEIDVINYESNEIEVEATVKLYDLADLNTPNPRLLDTKTRLVRIPARSDDVIKVNFDVDSWEQSAFARSSINIQFVDACEGGFDVKIIPKN